MRRALTPVLLGLALLATLGFQSANNFRDERIVGRGCLKAAGKNLTFNISGVPASGVLREKIYLPGYAGADTLAHQFNGDTGNNYRYEWLTAAAGGTTFAAGNVGATTDRIKLGASDVTTGRVIEVMISDNAGKTEKIVKISDVTGTGAVGTQAAWDLGNGAWVSGAGVTINSITIMTTTNNMAAGTCAVAYAD